ncbi:hypothetical protein, partial [Burkholderia pseudomallei]|uniref:hypothetical protein n=1 Tax=Burkholderia pseudomallei TaxID=28450 RepID=UPI001C3D1BE3
CSRMRSAVHPAWLKRMFSFAIFFRPLKALFSCHDGRVDVALYHQTEGQEIGPHLGATVEVTSYRAAVPIGMISAPVLSWSR